MACAHSLTIPRLAARCSGNPGLPAGLSTDSSHRGWRRHRWAGREANTVVLPISHGRGGAKGDKNRRTRTTPPDEVAQVRLDGEAMR